MGIIDKIESITASRNTIRTKMVTAGQATRNDKLSTLATNLSITDTSDATATAADIAEGKTAYVEGAKITGTSTKDADTSDATATADDILEGKTAYSNGVKLTGTATAGIDTSDATATAGDILSGATAYVNGSKLVGTIQSKSSQTYTPGTTDQTIASGQYLSGTQTIQGSSALTAANIKQGTSIFGVAGTFTSDATATAEDIAEGKTAYVNGSKLVGTASGGLDNSYGVIYKDPDSKERCHIMIDNNQEAKFIFTYYCGIYNRFNYPVTIGENITNCESMFQSCFNFNQPVNIPINATNCAYMFNSCNIFNQPITIPNNVNDCFMMFSNCYNFNQPIIIPDMANRCANMFSTDYLFNSQVIIGKNVTNCAYMFAYCNNFNRDIIIPQNVINCYAMFQNCSKLGGNIYIKSNVLNNAISMLGYCNNSIRKNIFFNRSLNSYFNMTGDYLTIVTRKITWSSMTNGFYNTAFNVYCYYNYSG